MLQFPASENKRRTQNRHINIINRLSFHKNIDFKKIIYFLYWAYLYTIDHTTKIEAIRGDQRCKNISYSATNSSLLLVMDQKLLSKRKLFLGWIAYILLFGDRSQKYVVSTDAVIKYAFNCDNLNIRARYDIVGGYSGSGFRRVLCYCIYIRVRYDIVGGYSGSGFRRVLCYCIYIRVRYDIVGGYSGSGFRRVLCYCC